MTHEKLNELRKAAAMLCNYCEVDECDKCIVTNLIDCAESEYEKENVDEDEE